jgi:hypothetical protein
LYSEDTKLRREKKNLPGGRKVYIYIYILHALIDLIYFCEPRGGPLVHEYYITSVQSVTQGEEDIIGHTDLNITYSNRLLQLSIRI